VGLGGMALAATLAVQLPSTTACVHTQPQQQQAAMAAAAAAEEEAAAAKASAAAAGDITATIYRFIELHGVRAHSSL